MSHGLWATHRAFRLTHGVSLGSALIGRDPFDEDLVGMMRLAQYQWGDFFTQSVKVATCVYRFMRAQGMTSIREWNELVEVVAHRASSPPGSYAVIRSLEIKHRKSRGFRPVKFNLMEGSGVCFRARPKYWTCGSQRRLEKILDARRQRERRERERKKRECEMCMREMASTRIRFLNGSAIPKVKMFEGVREYIHEWPRLCNSCWQKVKPICIAAHEANEIRRLTSQLQRERSNARQKA